MLLFIFLILLLKVKRFVKLGHHIFLRLNTQNCANRASCWQNFIELIQWIFRSYIKLIYSKFQICVSEWDKAYCWLYSLACWQAGIFQLDLGEWHSNMYTIMWIESPVYVWRRMQHAWGWCMGMIQKDVMGREVGGGFMFGNACKN